MRRYNMPARYLHDLISGAEMDLTVQNIRLSTACANIAIASPAPSDSPARTCSVFTDPRALDLAEKLGLAFQLTNIIRDVHDDYALGRVYLPAEDLARYDVVQKTSAAPKPRSACASCCDFEADRAWQFYEEGAELLGLIEQRKPWRALVAHAYL